MGRPFKTYSSAIEAEIVARTARGDSAAVIRAALHNAIPLSTLSRRQQELRRGGQTPPRLPLPAAPIDVDIPDAVPSDASDEDIDRWLRRLESAAKRAEAQENWAVVASLGAKYTALKALKMKHAPLPRADPADSPDYRALAATGRDRFLKLVEGVFNESAGLGSEEGRSVT